MLAVVGAAAVVALLVAAGLAVLYAVTVVPFLLAVDLAERRGLATGRWAGASLGAVLLALALALLAWRAGAGPPGVVLALAVGFAPAALVAVRGDRMRHPAGRHESSL